MRSKKTIAAVAAAVLMLQLIPYSYAEDSPVEITYTDVHDGGISYKLSTPDNVSDYDIYTALYNDDGVLESVYKNKPEGEFDASSFGKYMMKVFTFDRDTLTAAGRAQKKVLAVPVRKYDFENGLPDDADAKLTAGASIVNEDGGNRLYLNGAAGGYMQLDALKDETGAALEDFSVSFDIKNKTTGNYFNFYIGDGSSASSGKHYLSIKAADKVLISTVAASGEIKTTFEGTGVQGNWTHFDIVVSQGKTKLYVNRSCVGELSGYKMSEVNASVIRFGFSPWSADKSANAYYDNICLYDHALSRDEITGVVTSPRPAEDLENDRLLFAMNFNNGDMTPIKGKATLFGNAEYQESDDGSTAAVLNRSGSYISLASSDGSSLLAGRDEVTVMLRERTHAGPSWWFYASPDDSAQSYGQEHYLGLLDSGSQITAERYHNTGFRTDPAVYPYTAGEWREIALVISRQKSTLYINGKAVSEKAYSFTLSEMLGDAPVAYIGRANWGKGEWANGAVDDIAVYDFAPEFDLGNTDDVRGNIELPTADEKTDGYSVTWSSSDESVITSNGIVTVPESGKKTAVLTATVKFGAHILEKDYPITVKSENYSDYTISVSDEKGVDINPGMYGLFFEDINYAADGGLYAEMVENRSFEAIKSSGNGKTSFDGMYGWSAYPSGGTSGLELLSSGGLNANNTHYLRTSADIVNNAYEGVYMESGKTYNVSVYAKSSGYSGGLKAQVYSDGRLASEAVLAETLTDEWTKYTAVLAPTETVRNADLVIALTGQGTVDIDMVSCIPGDAVMGVFRRDLAEKLKAIDPGFLRFPGGCIIEGYNLANRYNWKDSVGSVEERKQNWSRWSCHTDKGLDNGFKHYNQTYGLGFYEYFLLCEYLDCAPVPVVNAGMACEFQSSETVPLYKSDGVTFTDEFMAYVDDALDLIEFANGDASTEWGRLRIEMGHEEPFGLEILGVGNEQWKKSGNLWYERYEAFEKAIHEAYPDIKLIATTGPNADGTDFVNSWTWIREKAAKNDSFTYAVDEHYYMSPQWFLDNDGRYDSYDRSVKVFAGEYASQGNSLRNALAEAAFMTGLERNADVVYMASYAPLFARHNFTQWSPDMIWFNDAESYVSPDYYVQELYSNNTGDYTLKSSVSGNDNKVYESVSYDSKTDDIIIKIANPYGFSQNITLMFEAAGLSGTADVKTLTSGSDADTNSIEEPDKVRTYDSQLTGIGNGSQVRVPAYSFTVLRVHTK